MADVDGEAARVGSDPTTLPFENRTAVAVAGALAEMVADGDRPLDETSKRTIELGVIDALACIVAGAQEDVSQRARRVLADVGREQGRVVIGSRRRAAPAQAAFLNATSGHALEFDDWEIPGNSHPSVVLVPAILAASVRPLSGPRLAAAYARGFEVIARVGESVNFEHYGRGWHTTATLGALGAAAAAAATLGLDQARTAHAISLACSRAAGLTAQFGSDAKALQAGFAAESGVSAALLAEAGLTGRLDVLEAPQGYAAITADVAPERFAEPLAKLAGPWAAGEHGLVVKAHPTCGYTHRVVDAATDLRSQLAVAGVTPDDVAFITIRIPELHASILPFMRPTSVVEARFSLPFAAAVTLLEGGIGLEDLRSARWNEPATAALMNRCRVETFTPKRPELNYDRQDPDHVTVETVDGRRLDARVAFPLGSPERPMTKTQVLDKAVVLTGATVEARAALDCWLNVGDIRKVIDVLDPPHRQEDCR